MNEVKTLGAVIASREGRIFCSTERLGPCPDSYQLERATNAWMPDGDYGVRVEFEYSTRFVASDTLKGDLRRGETISIIAEHVRTRGDLVVFAPLVMGSPWLASDGRKLDFAPEWLAQDFYENYIEDIDEFARVVGTPDPESPVPMERFTPIAKCLRDIREVPSANLLSVESAPMFGVTLGILDSNRTIPSAADLKLIRAGVFTPTSQFSGIARVRTFCGNSTCLQHIELDFCVS